MYWWVLPFVCFELLAFIHNSLFAQSAEGTQCDDGTKETINDVCVKGVCKGQKKPQESSSSGSSDYAIIGGVAAAVVTLSVLVGFLLFRKRSARHEQRPDASFENPLYDSSVTAQKVQDNTGYMVGLAHPSYSLCRLLHVLNLASFCTF